MKKRMMKYFAFVLCAILAAQSCITPAAALEKEVSVDAQTESSENITPYAQYVPYYSAKPPAGASSSDYKGLTDNHTGNVTLDQMAAEWTMEKLIEIVAPSVGADYEDLLGDALGDVFSGLQVAVKKYAPEGGNMKYQRLTYKNTKLSNTMNEYYMHLVTYTLPGGQKESVRIYETRSWI